jgi:hypothetical protein
MMQQQSTHKHCMRSRCCCAQVKVCRSQLTEQAPIPKSEKRFARQHIYESINLRGWRPWRPVRVEQPNPQLHQSEQPFRAIQATAGGEQCPAPASVFELSVQPFCSQGAPTGALIPSNRCLHDACEVGWRAGRDQWNLGMGQQALHQAH